MKSAEYKLLATQIEEAIALADAALSPAFANDGSRSKFIARARLTYDTVGRLRGRVFLSVEAAKSIDAAMKNLKARLRRLGEDVD